MNDLGAEHEEVVEAVREALNWKTILGDQSNAFTAVES